MRARVAPGLEVVGRRDVPVAERGRLVEEQAGVDDEADLAHRLGELEVGGRAQNRVRFADDHEHLHVAGVDVGDKLGERGASVRLGTTSGVGR